MGAPCIALVGNLNCGKTALFNLLSGARQKVANYAGVTVERKVGTAVLADGSRIRGAAPAAPRSSAELQQEGRRILALAAPASPRVQRLRLAVDAFVLHPVAGLALLAGLLFLMFQAVFSRAERPMHAIEAGMAALGDLITGTMDDGPLRSLLVDGVIAGAGGVLVFLPQLLILCFFILLLEDSG